MKYSELKCETPNEAAAPLSAGRHVFFTRLDCHVTEDSGADECILVIDYHAADGTPRRQEFRRDMNKGERWVLPQTGFPLFGGEATAKLWDEDGPFDGDDFLGGVFVRSNLGPGEFFADFTGDGANYRLNLRIDP